MRHLLPEIARQGRARVPGEQMLQARADQKYLKHPGGGQKEPKLHLQWWKGGNYNIISS